MDLLSDNCNITRMTRVQMSGEMAGALMSEVDRLDSMISYKKQLVDTNIRCPLSKEVRYYL